jgi:molybdopterin-binding protein
MLKAGDAVTAIIKATEVMIGKQAGRRAHQRG